MTPEYFYGHLFWLIIVILLYYTTLQCILLITDLLSCGIIKKFILPKNSKMINEKHFIKILVFSTISYFISIVSIYICFSLLNEEVDLLTFFLVIYRVVTESITEPQLTVIFIISVLAGFCVNLIFNFFIVFRDLKSMKAKRLISTLIVSFMTAPYFIFASFEEILNGIYYLI